MVGILCLLASPATSDRSLALDALIVQRAQRFLPVGSGELRVLKLSRPAGLPAVVDPEKTAVVFRQGEDFSGTTLIGLELEGGHKRWVHAVFELQVPTAVARTRLVRGHRLVARDLLVTLVAMDKLPSRRPGLPAELVGLVLEADVAEGDPIPVHRLKRPVVVKRGDRVEIVVANGRVQIRAAGSAMAAGRVGDTIVVERGQHGQRIKARVAGPGQVVVHLGTGR
jgi:flagella basal body P-ring formation protein FlgA